MKHSRRFCSYFCVACVVLTASVLIPLVIRRFDFPRGMIALPEVLLLTGGGVLVAVAMLRREILRRQVEALGREARQIAEPVDLSRRVQVVGCDEIRAVAASLNQLAAAHEQANRFLERESLETQGLRRTCAEHREWLQALPVPYGLCDMASGRFLEVGDGLLELLGCRRADVIGRTDRELQIWPDLHARESWWELVAERKQVRDVECQWRTRSGELRHVALSGRRVESGGDACLLFVAHDLSERLASELHCRQAQKMEAVGRLAAGFAHDFNNILCVVQGYTNLVLSDSRLEAQHQSFLKQVAQASDRGASLTRQLLVLGGRQTIKPRLVDLNAVLQGLTSMVEHVLGEKVTLRLNLTPDLPGVKADAGMVEQLVMNLALNARDAMPTGGQWTLSTQARMLDAAAARQMSEARQGEFVVVSLSDTGCGMARETLARLFEPFFSTKDPGKGTGLGLATVYGIVKQHKGWIEVASHPGKGTTFEIFLPACRTAVEPAASGVGSRRLHGQERVLVVEDEPAVLAMVQSILVCHGYGVVAAVNGAEALRLWEGHADRIDLLLTDMVMPEGISGRELAERLKLKRPDLKVIFTSGYSTDLMGLRGQDLVEGMNFIQKPYRPQVLVETVRNRLDVGLPNGLQSSAQAVA